MTGDGSKVRCCKEQHCIKTWNVRSINQGKLEVVRQEMARLNINNLGISELKWTGMGEFNSDDHYIYYCGQVVLYISLNCRSWLFLCRVTGCLATAYCQELTLPEKRWHFIIHTGLTELGGGGTYL